MLRKEVGFIRKTVCTKLCTFRKVSEVKFQKTLSFILCLTLWRVCPYRYIRSVRVALCFTHKAVPIEGTPVEVLSSIGTISIFFCSAYFGWFVRERGHSLIKVLESPWYPRELGTGAPCCGLSSRGIQELPGNQNSA